MRLGPAFLLVGLLLLGACGGNGAAPEAPSAATHRFSFVVLADPHVFSEGDASDRLQACADWIAAEAQDEAIELVFVVGDLGSLRSRVAEILDALAMPWIPLIGDNVVQGGDEAGFDADLAPHYASLAGELAGWVRRPTPVTEPGTGRTLHLQNWAFDHGGLRFVGLDWCTRDTGQIVGEQADLHDFPGGTFPFFEAEIQAQAQGPGERIVMLSHHPMHDFAFGLGSFSGVEIDAIEAVTGAHAGHVYASFAGHYHVDQHEVRATGGYEVFVTDATWDDQNTLRLVRVLSDGAAFSYEHELVRLP
jgi:hypothetical protein